MYQTLESQILLGLVVLSVAFAWWKGGAPERIGALFNGVSCLGVPMVQVATAGCLDTLPMPVARFCA